MSTKNKRWTVVLVCTDDETWGPTWDAHVHHAGEHVARYPVDLYDVVHEGGRHRLRADTKARLLADAKG